MGRPCKNPDKRYDDLIPYLCKSCGIEFLALRYRKRKVCNLSCWTKYRVKSGEFGGQLGNPRKGNPKKWKHSASFKLKRQRNGNPNWKGDNVNSRSLHSWIKLNFKKNRVCKHCGRQGKTDWSNKDHRYSRKRKDWQELCRSCHQLFDYKNGLR